jgi:hypothetical protein
MVAYFAFGSLQDTLVLCRITDFVEYHFITCAISYLRLNVVISIEELHSYVRTLYVRVQRLAVRVRSLLAHCSAVNSQVPIWCLKFSVVSSLLSLFIGQRHL